MDKRIRVLIVDDHTLFREGLSRLLEADTDFELVGACASVREALIAIGAIQIDVVLLDYDLNEEIGVRLLADSQRSNFTGKFLIVTSGMSDAAILRAIDDGVAGIFLKNSPLAELIPAIIRVTRGETWIDPGVVKTLIAGAHTAREVSIQEDLSERERNVLRGVFEGLSNKEISQRIGVSEGSVKAALQQLFTRSGVRTRSQLVRIAVEKHSADWLAS